MHRSRQCVQLSSKRTCVDEVRTVVYRTDFSLYLPRFVLVT